MKLAFQHVQHIPRLVFRLVAQTLAGNQKAAKMKPYFSFSFHNFVEGSLSLAFGRDKSGYMKFKIIIINSLYIYSREIFFQSNYLYILTVNMKGSISKKSRPCFC